MDKLDIRPIDEPLTIFLIGITGDLSRKKILKALYQLFIQRLLPSKFHVIGVARRELNKAQLHTFLHDAIRPETEEHWSAFCHAFEQVSGDITERSTFEKLKVAHDKLEQCGNHLWYLATLPSLYLPIIEHIGELSLHTTKCGWSKLLLEKPFGTDLATAKDLNEKLLKLFSENQIFRVDHYLAKETVQNLLVFRFANGMFENLWDKKYIDHIQVNAMETLGIAGREHFYEGVGTIRDYVQSHVLQMIATTMMEEPKKISPEMIRQERQDLLAHLQIEHTDGQLALVRGQYTAGEVDSESVVGYRDEKNIPADSETETAVAMKVVVDHPRWQGVPVYIRAGKRLSRSVTEISIQFKETPNQMFGEHLKAATANILTFRISPNEGVVARFFVKRPGINLELEEVPMQFCYSNQFQMELVEAYVKLIHDAVQGDVTFFPQAKEIELGWQVVQPALTHPTPLEHYAAGSWGPPGFDQLLHRDGRKWIEPSIDVCPIR